LSKSNDTVLIPALAMAETHWHRGEFDENRRKFILQSLRASVEEMGERQLAVQAKLDAAAVKEPNGAPTLRIVADTSKLCVLCLPAHDEADEIAAHVLAQLLVMRGYSTHVASIAALVSERVALVEERNPDVVCISATPPAAAMHARYLCRRLRGRFPEANLIVGCGMYKGTWTRRRSAWTAARRRGWLQRWPAPANRLVS
jgi:hypothetical protein